MAGERADGAADAIAPGRDAGAGLIAQRLRETAATAAPPPAEPLSPHAVTAWLEGDAGHLHRAGDLAAVPIASHRRLLGRPVVAAKRTVRRLLFPLIDIQSGVNAANARAITFLLTALGAQARSIDELQREVAQLRAEREP